MSKLDATGSPLTGKAGTVVIGGGIAGTSACYHLAKAGEDVVLLERGSIGGGATSAAVGVLSPPLRQPFHETVRFAGPEAAKVLWQFAQRSIDGLAAVLTSRKEDESSELDLSGGYVLAEAHSLHEVEDAYRALEAADLPVAWMDPGEIRSMFPFAKGFTGAIKILGGGAIAPGPTTQALADAAAAEGATVLEDVDVNAIVRDTDGFRIDTDRGEMRCKRVVHATHVDIRRFSPFLKQEVVPIRGQGFRTAPMERVFHGAFATHWKLNVWRQDAEGRLMVSGWRHDAWSRSYGQDSPELDPRLQTDLVRWFESTFSGLGPLDVRDRWSGVFGWTADFLPLVGAIPGAGDGEYVTSGFSGGGLPFAFEAGRIVACMVTGSEPPIGSAVFDPARFDR
jgi:glycine/D-amino acid oxidase-like deaminating enzyme